MRTSRWREWLSLSLLAGASVFACEHGEETARSERAPRHATTTIEDLALGDGSSKIEHVTGELTTDIEAASIPPASLTVVAARRVPLAATRSDSRSDGVLRTPELEAPAHEIVSPETPPPPATPVTTPPPSRSEPRTAVWANVEPAPKQRSTALDISLAVGAIGVGMGTAAVATGDGQSGQTAFSLVCLGIGAVGFSSAFVIWAVGPGTIGVNGRF